MPGSKSDAPKSERESLASKGKAMPDSDRGGRFPITNRDDLRRAIRAVGRAKGGEEGRRKVRRYIIRRARGLGLTSMLPDNWDKSTGALKS